MLVLWVQIYCFLPRALFLLKIVTDSLNMVIETRIFDRYFLRNYLSLSIKWKYQAVFVKIQVKIRNLGSFYLSLWMRHLPKLKDFSGDISGDVNDCYVTKCWNIWKICLTRWTNISQITNIWCYEIMHG